MENLKKIEIKENIIRVLKGSTISVIITLVALLIYAIVLTYTNISETSIKSVIIIITAISILIGSTISTLKTKKKGILNRRFCRPFIYISYIFNFKLNWKWFYHKYLYYNYDCIINISGNDRWYYWCESLG